MADAVHNMARTALITLAFATDRPELLREALGDRFHQPGRATIFPHFVPCMDAALASGAVYAFLSGAGPTVCALVSGRYGEGLILPAEDRRYKVVGAAMLQAGRAAGVEGRIVVTQPSDKGAHYLGAHARL